MPIQPKINRTFDYGKQGTIEYKPNWGQPITETGQWQSQSQPTTPTAPVTAPQVDPYKIIDKNLGELKNNFKNRVETLKGYKLAPDAFNKILAQMQEEYDNSKAKVASTRLQLDTIKQGVASGQIDPINGQKAMMQLVVPQGTVEAMFPKPEKQPTPLATGVSPSGMEALVERFDTLRKGMLGYPEGKKLFRWDTKKAIPEKMIKRYFTERNIANLNDPRNAAKIPGFNQAFIQSMQQDERTAELIEKLLDPKTGDPRMVAAFSPDSKVNRAFINQFGVAKTQPISPMADALQKQKPKISLGTKIGIGLAGATPIGGHLTRRWMNKKRQALENKLPTVSTDEDYDKLQSGDRFVDPNGDIRTKP